MTSSRETTRYRYDALDRLVAYVSSEQASIRCFYLKSRLVTEIQGSVRLSLFQHEDQLLAQHQSGLVESTLLAVDHKRSVLNTVDVSQSHPFVYTPFGHRLLLGRHLSPLGFNGEKADPITGHYLLGNGYRAFNPVLMRFNSPDSRSPFREGGLNAYAYCLGDPVNREDSTGHSSVLARFFVRLGRRANQVFSGKPNIGPKIRAENTKRIAPQLVVFDSYNGSKKQLNIVTHGYSGTDPKYGGMHLNSPSEDMAWTPEEFVSNISSAGVFDAGYKRIDLIMCYGADGGAKSFAQQVANLTNVPTKSYFGNVISRKTYVDQALKWVRVHRDSQGAGIPDYKYKSAIFKPVQHKR